MVLRNVTGTGKDPDGDITSLCGDFVTVSKATAISDINAGTHVYMVNSSTKVHVVEASGGKDAYLRTTANPSSDDNLDNLPNC